MSETHLIDFADILLPPDGSEILSKIFKKSKIKNQKLEIINRQ